MKRYVEACSEEWICPGPSTTSFPERYIGTNEKQCPGKGTKVSYNTCMQYPDCGCPRFYEQAEKVERVYEEMENE